MSIFDLVLLGLADGSVHVGEHTSGSNGDLTQELGELLVVTDGQLNVAGDNSALLVVASGVTGELEDLSDEILQDCGHVDGGAGTNTRGEAGLLHVACKTADRELQTSLSAAALGGTGFLSNLTTTTLTLA